MYLVQANFLALDEFSSLRSAQSWRGHWRRAEHLTDCAACPLHRFCMGEHRLVHSWCGIRGVGWLFWAFVHEEAVFGWWGYPSRVPKSVK